MSETVTHVRIGDPEPIGFGSSTTYNCSCACATCLMGGCCRPLTVTWPTTVPMTTGWACTSSGHDFQPFPEHLTARLYCRKCGEVRSAELPTVNE